MAYTSQVNQIATDETNRRNSTIGLADTLQNSASNRSLQKTQEGTMRTNAAANMMNAATNSRSASAEAGLKAAALQQDAKQFDATNALQQQELGLKSAAINSEIANADRTFALSEAKLGPELEHLNLQNDSMRLEYGANALKFQMEKAMTEGNMKQLPKLFAMQEAMMDAKTVGHRSEVGLQKWGLLARYGSGITHALDSGRQSDAMVLHQSMMTDIEEMGIDVKNLGILNEVPSFDNKDSWKLFSDVAVNSAELRSQIALEQAKNGGNTLEYMLKMLQANLANDRNARGAEDQISDNMENFQQSVGTTIAPYFKILTNKDGQVKADADGQKVTPMYNSVLGAIKAATMDATTGQFRPGMNMVKAQQLGNALGQNLVRASVDTPGPSPIGSDNEEFLLQPTGILIDSARTLLYRDPRAEIEAVMSDRGYEDIVKPGLENWINEFATNNPRVERGIRKTIIDMDNTKNPIQRARLYEGLVHSLTTIKILGQ